MSNRNVRQHVCVVNSVCPDLLFRGVTGLPHLPTKSTRAYCSMSRGDGYDELYEVIGERIADARRALGMSQAKLAVAVGLTRASVVNIERGRQRPPVHLIWQVAATLNVEATRLIPLKRELDARGAPVQLDANVVAYIEQFARNDPSTKRLLTDFIQRATSKIEGNDGRPDEASGAAT